MTPDEIIDRLRASLKSERKLRQEAQIRLAEQKAHNRYLNAVIEQMRGELTTQARGLADLDRIVLEVKADAERKRR
jgi:hypothetical protein